VREPSSQLGVPQGSRYPQLAAVSTTPSAAKTAQCPFHFAGDAICAVDGYLGRMHCTALLWFRMWSRACWLEMKIPPRRGEWLAETG